MRSETRGSRFEFQVEIDILPVTVTYLRFILITFVFLPSGQAEERREPHGRGKERQLRTRDHDLDHFMITIIIIIIIINNNNIIIIIIIIIIINGNIIIIIIIIIIKIIISV